MSRVILQQVGKREDGEYRIAQGPRDTLSCGDGFFEQVSVFVGVRMAFIATGAQAADDGPTYARIETETGIYVLTLEED